MDINKKIDQINNKLNLKKFNDVINDCNKLIKVNPNISILYNFLGLAFQAKLNHSESLICFKKAIELDQKDFAPKINLANTYMHLNDFQNSEKIFNKLLLEKPDEFLLIANYANFKKKIKQFKDAVKLYEDAVKKSNSQLFIMNDLARIYLNIGDFEKSKNIYEKLIDKFPLLIDAHISLSRLINYSNDRTHLDKMIDIYNKQKLSDKEKGILCFGISKAYEDLRNFEKSYIFFKKANNLIDKNLNFSLENEKKLFNSIKKTFDNFHNIQLEKTQSKKIIFVCGLPRSGTTLVEQILSSHKDVIGIGEVEYLEKGLNELIVQDNKILSQNFKNNIHSNNLFNFYMKQIEVFGYLENTIVDKTPHNFRWLGFIKNSFPKAKIVLCKRNLKDNFLSIFKNYFASNKHMGWSFNPENIITYFNMYLDLTNFWIKKYPKDIHVLDYDKLVQNKEEEIKILLEKCNLNWDQNCLLHHKNTKGTINTVSIIQARKPIYKSSKNLSWKYQNYLKSYFEKLVL